MQGHTINQDCYSDSIISKECAVNIKSRPTDIAKQ